MTMHKVEKRHSRCSPPVLLACLTVLVAVGVLSPSARAEVPGPGWGVIGRTEPTSLPPGGEGQIKVYVMNLGAGDPTSGETVEEVLPEGLSAEHGYIEEHNTSVVGECSLPEPRRVVCAVPVPEYPRQELENVIAIPVKVSTSATGQAIDRVSVSGGGALETAHTNVPISYGVGEPRAGFAGLSTWLTGRDGAIDTRAGSHPYELTVAFALNDIFTGNAQSPKLVAGDERPAGGEVRGLDVNLPPGLVGNPQAVPQCLLEQFEEEQCPDSTEVGENLASLFGADIFPEKIYNVVPRPGVAAQFAFQIQKIPVFLDSGVRSGGDDGITTHANNLPERNIVFNISKIWGVPAEANHNGERYGAECAPATGEECPAGVPEKALLTMPSSCGAPLQFSAEMLGTWTDESYRPAPAKALLEDESGPVGLTGCEKLAAFGPTIAIVPETSYADTPTGLAVSVKMPGLKSTEGVLPGEEVAAPGLKDTTVVLPEGVVVNPGQATGLVACQAAEEALGTLPNGEVNEGPPSCPEASKVGTDEITTPLLPGVLKGNVYILQKNPPELELLVSASGEGVNLKLVGQVHLDAQTGQLTSTFADTPDLPFTEFKLDFSGGARAALATPTRCGSYESSVDFTPWSSPLMADVLQSSDFAIDAGPGGSACAWSMGFSPSLAAGSTSETAGGYTGFTMQLQRGDGQQRIGSLRFTTPPGLLGMISHVALCGEPQAASGACPAGSQIGNTVATSGPGPYPFEVPQAGGPPAPIYLTGPYQGAPYGLSIVVPVVAGPFNLGTVVVRAKIEVDPHTSQLTVTTGELPRILDGIPTDLREIVAEVNRPQFMFNPTNCDPLSFTGTATSLEGASAPLSYRFRVGSCQALGFKPRFTVSTSGKTSRADGASLTAKIVYPSGNLGAGQATSQANIRSVKVDLPRQLPSRLTTLQKACPVATFDANPAGCQAASIIGHAKAVTPLLALPLEGPVYFVSHGGAKFPELIVVLQGDNVTVEVDSETFISPAGITSSTFRQVPDVPVESFELTLPQGRDSALTANGSLCKVKGGLEMPTAFVAQNGDAIHESTKVGVTGCPPTRPKAHRAKKGKKHKAKRRPRGTTLAKRTDRT
jgi:hypothetical protein